MKSGAQIVLVSVSMICLSLAGSRAWAGDFRSSDVDAAVKNLSSKDQWERKTAAYKLSEMGEAAKAAVPTLIEVLQTDPSMSVRGETSSALGHIGPGAEAAVPALIAFLMSIDGGYERTYAASALGDIGQHSEQAVPVLIEALQHDEEPVVRHLSARALAGFGAKASPAIPALIGAIKDGDKEMRESAAYGLEHIPGSASEIKPLTDLLSDEIDSARTAAAKSLAGMGSEAVSAVPALVNLLNDKNQSVRAAAAEALGKIGPDAKSAVPALKQALNDAQTRSEVAEALEHIQGKN
jgi:HEAT repeat protein